MSERKIVELTPREEMEKTHGGRNDLSLPQRLFVLASAIRQKNFPIDPEKACALIEEAAEALLRRES
jgi:hypothetical protein